MSRGRGFSVIYLDHNATSPLHPVARAAWLEASEQFIGNPSSLHRLGARADAALERAREKLAAILGCQPTDLIWTSGASESNNAAIQHLARTAAEGRTQLWVSPIEHPSVLEPARYYFGSNLRFIPVSPSGIVDLDWLAKAFARARPAAVAVMAANNETGILQPWSALAGLCRDHGVPLLCDAVQWIGRLPAAGFGACDFVSASAHKFGGPRGVGFLKVPAKASLKRLIHGGPQELGRRAGTENVPGILAMIAALELREGMLSAKAHELIEQAKETFEQEAVAALPGAEIIGNAEARLWNTTSIIMPPGDGCFRWVVKLDKAGFAVSTGSACSSGEEKPSHVLTAMGYTAAQIQRTLRISRSWETPASDATALLSAIQALAPTMASAEADPKSAS